MLQGFTRRASNATYTSPFSVPVHRTISPGLFGPVHQIRLAAPFTSTVLRPRFQLCSPDSSPELFSILVPGTVHHPRHLNRSPSPFTELFHRNYSALFIRFVSQSRSPQPSSVHVFSSVLRPRLLNHSPSSSPPPSSILVSGTVLRPVSVTVLHPCLRNRPSSSSPLPFSVLVFSRPVFLM